MPATTHPSSHHPDQFVHRHIGPSPAELTAMAQACGATSVDDLIAEVLPPGIESQRSLDLPPAISEAEALAELQAIASDNKVMRSLLGMGYHDCVVPAVIQRNVLENPAWYTQYTPYQAEISQGRLEGLLHFQTVISQLSGLPVANCSLLDEATAAAEAMFLAWGQHRGKRTHCFISRDCHPQVIDVIKTRAWPLAIKIIIGDDQAMQLDDRFFAVLLPYPATDGSVHDHRAAAQLAHDHGAMVIADADLLALTMLPSPASWGADICVGPAQRFGTPLGFGGPHAGYIAVGEALKRKLPGRIVGVSQDRHGNPALRLALQTREQHIRREKATSNICTAQALLANMNACYAIYHGPHGLRAIADHIHHLACRLAAGLRQLGYDVGKQAFFDTIRINLSKRPAATLLDRAEYAGFNLRLLDSQTICIALDECSNQPEIEQLWQIFDLDGIGVQAADLDLQSPWRADQLRQVDYLSEPVFHQHHSETAMLRYLKRLEERDLSLCHAMIPLGSCTMKLNASIEMAAVSWPAFSSMHPFAPAPQTKGYITLFQQLEQWLADVTGFAGISLQPNAGSQGEFAGLLAIRAYHKSRGDEQRDCCLIPTSAHGTNPASATLAGMKVVAVRCNERGDIDLDDLRAKAEQHADRLAALMITYPSTHGVFEDAVKEVCAIVHQHGGQVYMDGANMNAQVGLCKPGELGADVCHLNLHKTFCIPHGGGGPGVGPIGVARHLVPFLPSHPVVRMGGDGMIGAVSAAPWGSASILVIPWMYMRMMGGTGLRRATEAAIVSANYIAHQLQDVYPILYTGTRGRVAHECIIDLRQWKHTAGITDADVAKRLIDYGFHAPTMSFPVAGTMMIEPTESEPLAEVDRFITAMRLIEREVQAIILGTADADDNLLLMAPHTAAEACADDWSHPYSRQQAVYPLGSDQQRSKFWPVVARVDNAFGDRNLICSCVGMAAYSGELASAAS